jgi:ribonuclease J
VIIFSSHPIPGNEKAVTKVINELAKKGASIIHQDTHVSGHACQEEIKLIYTLTKPQYAIPVHGEYHHLKRHRDLAIAMGVPRDNVFVLQSGDVLSISPEQAKVTGKVPAQGIFVDGFGVGDVGNIVLRDRQLLSQNGLLIVVVTLDRYNGLLLAGPDIVSRGFVYVRENEDLIEDAKQVVTATLEQCARKKITDWTHIKSAIRDDLDSVIWKRLKRSPMILPIIMEV